MYVFCIRYDDVDTIIKEFFAVRMRMYVKRKEYLELCLEAESSKLGFQAKFIIEKCSGKIVVENKQRKTMVDELVKRGYPVDPVKEWKQRLAREMKTETCDDDKASVDDEEEEEEEEEAASSSKKKGGKQKDPEKSFNNLTDVKKYDYLLGMSMWMLTLERKNQLLKQRDIKLEELRLLKEKKPSDLWRNDLDIFAAKLEEVEEQERREEVQIMKKEPRKTKVKVHCLLNIICCVYITHLFTGRSQTNINGRCRNLAFCQCKKNRAILTGV